MVNEGWGEMLLNEQILFAGILFIGHVNMSFFDRLILRNENYEMSTTLLLVREVLAPIKVNVNNY